MNLNQNMDKWIKEYEEDKSVTNQQYNKGKHL